MNRMLVCTNCGEAVVKSSSDCMKIRGKVLVIREDTVCTVCKGCGTEIPVPLKLESELFKAHRTDLRLFIKKR